MLAELPSRSPISSAASSHVRQALRCTDFFCENTNTFYDTIIWQQHDKIDGNVGKGNTGY